MNSILWKIKQRLCSIFRNAENILVAQIYQMNFRDVFLYAFTFAHSVLLKVNVLRTKKY